MEEFESLRKNVSGLHDMNIWKSYICTAESTSHFK